MIGLKGYGEFGWGWLTQSIRSWPKDDLRLRDAMDLRILCIFWRFTRIMKLMAGGTSGMIYPIFAAIFSSPI